MYFLSSYKSLIIAQVPITLETLSALGGTENVLDQLHHCLALIFKI